MMEATEVFDPEAKGEWGRFASSSEMKSLHRLPSQAFSLNAGAMLRGFNGVSSDEQSVKDLVRTSSLAAAVLGPTTPLGREN